jgi:hypothetical protein
VLASGFHKHSAPLDPEHLVAAMPLCNLRGLLMTLIHHRDTGNTEVAQRCLIPAEDPLKDPVDIS